MLCPKLSFLQLTYINPTYVVDAMENLTIPRDSSSSLGDCDSLYPCSLQFFQLPFSSPSFSVHPNFYVYQLFLFTVEQNISHS